MATTSGKGGSVEWASSAGANGTALMEVVSWSMTRNTIVHEYHATDGTGAAGSGSKERIAGVADWSATVNCKYDASTNIAPTAGQETEVTLLIDENEATAGQYDRYYGNCVVDDVQVEVDVDSGKIIAYVLTISGDGSLTFDQSTPP